MWEMSQRQLYIGSMENPGVVSPQEQHFYSIHTLSHVSQFTSIQQTCEVYNSVSCYKYLNKSKYETAHSHINYEVKTKKNVAAKTGSVGYSTDGSPVPAHQ
jgi:hypothetical protein